MGFLTHLECSNCGHEHSSEEPQYVCRECDKPLFARYDLSRVAAEVDRSALRDRSPTLWRYHELLPVLRKENVVSLGEGMTPLVRAVRLGKRLGGAKHIWIKDESQIPTGTFKARGLAVAVSKAKELGITQLAIPSAGNAAGALAVYGARADMEVYIFMPKDAPEINKKESRITGAHVHLVEGLISDAAKLLRQHISDGENWFDVSTLREPYRVEGKKTMGFELAEQMGWKLPDVILYPTGGGTGLIGMWKAFDELEAIGWIRDTKRPRMVSVQTTGCAPIVKAFQEGKEESEFWENAYTIAAGLRVPKALGDFLILRAIRESGGTAVAVSDEEILSAIGELAESEGIFACPEGAATVAGLKRLLENGLVSPEENIVLFNTGSGLKYPEIL
jgi:threonine synthase